MASTSNWRVGLGAANRFDMVQQMYDGRRIENAGEASPSSAQKAAFAAETEAYNSSTSREAYEDACGALAATAGNTLKTSIISPVPHSSGLVIGPYQDCRHVTTGLVSEVYQSNAVALKVIKETRNVEPHNAAKEVKILNGLAHPSLIKLIETSKDAQDRLILVFPFMPLTLASVLTADQLPAASVVSYFKDIFSALSYLHSQSIIHRDIKPSNILLASPTGPAFIADFGTAWHPVLSLDSEPPSEKVLDIGTSSYRAPETLFGNRSYDTSLDMWAAGVTLAECVLIPSRPLFESRSAFEDGNQLGLILSIFKTIGTPTKETWPEAVGFSTPPFEWYQEFPGHGWKDLLPDAPDFLRNLVGGLVQYESQRRLTAEKALVQLLDSSGRLTE